jgi:hypothetical protein
MLRELYRRYTIQSGNYIEHDKQQYQHYELVLEDCHDRLSVAKVHVLIKNSQSE